MPYRSSVPSAPTLLLMLPLAKPRGRQPAVISIEDGEATLTLHDVRMHEAYRLRLSAP
jgi:hypothetical protein